MGRRRKSIPDRWLDYSCFNSNIPGTRIIPFKTPLKKSVFQNETFIAESWTPNDVVNKIPDLGLVINLCYARNPYYVVEDFQKLGVDYVWIPCEGQVIPKPSVLNKFVDCVEEFLENEGNYSRLIGVHCTHGVNRTGYVVCNYLIKSLNILPEEAVNVFETSRGHKMDRLEYVEALYNL